MLIFAAACSGGNGGTDSALIATADERGSFSVQCPYSHSAPDDPIVHPGHEGMSHRHDFFGATTTDADSDAESLLAGGTTCRNVADKAAYWAPSLLVDGEPIEPAEMIAYYRVPIGADATQVEPPPNGLAMIAGEFTSTGPQDTGVVAWRCGAVSPDAVDDQDLSPVPTYCGPGRELLLRLRFDPCWDGENLDSEDHRSHVAPLDDDGACPGSHPVLFPEITVEIRYPNPPDGELALASGPLTGGHGDVFMAWDEDFIAREVELCLNANRHCDVVSASTRLDVDQLDEQ